jgi:ParB-like chromosome segregation protein Spo0J
VIVHAETSNSDLRILQLIENLQREELDELEEAVAIRELMQLADLSLAEVASRIGKTKAYAQRRVDLLYDPRLTEAVRHGIINASVALELRRFPHEQRSRYLERIAAGERLEVAQLREEKRRAREIPFGDVKRQRTGAAGRSPDGAEHPDGSAPRAGESYRIDTAAATEQSLDTPPETPGAGQATEIAGTPSDDPWMNDGAKSYRFDTIRDDSASPSSPDTESVLEPNLQSSSTRNGYADDAGAAAWAARIVEEILLPDRQGPLHQAELTTAVQAWRSAGSPAGGGDSLLHILADRLGCQ